MAWLGKIALVAGMLVLAFAQAVPAQRLLRGSDLSFAVLEATPQEMERLPAVDYHAASKFPHYERLLDFEFKPSVKREEFGIGERLDLIFEPGRSGYVSIIDYCADGVARVILRNRAVQAGFRYSFGGEVSEPAGRDYLRAVLSSLPLSYASLKALCEFPFSHERQVNHVLQERWLAINVSGRYRSPYFSEGDDPFYDRPRTWYRHLGDEQYLYAQPYRGTVRARGLSVATRAQTYSDFTEFGPAEYWLLTPGDELEGEFEVRAFPADSRTVYLLLYLATDRPRELFSDLELPKLRVRFNGMTIADELTPRYAEFYEDAPPLVLEMGDYLRYGKNSVELRVDPFADIGLRLRRLEIRTRLSALAYYDEWPE